MSLRSPISPPAQPRPHERRASSEAVGKVVDFISLALRRHGVPHRDRHDLVQEILLAALESWPRYDAEIATPEKWLNGIILHHVQRGRARSAKDPLLEEAEQEPRDEARSAEELLMSEERRELAHRLYQEIPFKYRDAMIAKELDGLTLEDISVSRGIPVSTAHYYVQEGIRHLRAAFARWQAKHRNRGVLLLPLTVEALLDADRSIPRAPDEIREIAWRLVERTLGPTALDTPTDHHGHSPGPSHDDGPATALAHPPAAQEPPNPLAPAATDEPPMHLPPVATARPLLVPVGVALIVGLIAGAWLDSVFRARRDPIAREPAPVVSAAPVASVAISPAPSTTASAPPPEPLATAPPAAGTGRADSLDAVAEQTAFDTARAAFAQGNMTAALLALEQHAQRYPQGPNAAERDRMWIEALIRLGRTAEACLRVESFRRAHKADYAERLGELCSMMR